MVHSGIIFWQIKLCKRRRFLSDTGIGSFLVKSSQDPVRPVLANSGGPSLQPLPELWPALSRPSPLTKSGNMRIRLLPSGGPPKVTITGQEDTLVGTLLTRDGWYTGHAWHTTAETPTYKSGRGLNSPFCQKSQQVQFPTAFSVDFNKTVITKGDLRRKVHGEILTF